MRKRNPCLLFCQLAMLFGWSQGATDCVIQAQQPIAENYHPAWSHGGAKIAFMSGRDEEAMEIYVMNADGSNIVRLTHNPGPDWDPEWSADGKRIAFSSDRDGHHEIYVMNADGTHVRRLTFTD